MIIDTHVHFADSKIPNTALFRLEMPEVFKNLTEQYGVESVIHVETRPVSYTHLTLPTKA